MAGTDDIYAALLGGAPTDDMKRQALINSLRNQKNLGGIAAMTGDAALAPYGQEQMKSADSAAQQLGAQRLEQAGQQMMGQYRQGELAQQASALKETMRQHNLEFAEKQMEYGLGPYGGSGGPGSEVAKKIANYDLPPLNTTFSRNPRNLNIMNEVMQLNPDYDATKYGAKKKTLEDFANSKGAGGAVKSFNVGLYHLDQLEQIFHNLNNGNIPLVNKLKIGWKQETGSEFPQEFQAMQHVVAQEVTKAIMGSGSATALQDRDRALQDIDAASSPKALEGVVNTYKGAMAGQLMGMRQHYTANTMKDDFDEKYLTKQSRGVLGIAEPQSTTSAPAGWKIEPVQ